MRLHVAAKLAIAVAVVGVPAVVGLVAAWVFNPAWDNCASYVEGRLVEHNCD